ncbi:hypothetical protein [Paenibacillus senegalensis]|uniref:hypothetical protein n=1 Tax=Paenibacillus senegalensis TaxID=1465766 RepID=UPI0002882954|nr:hypothetical protein [Paenibacillus senegalensis]
MTGTANLTKVEPRTEVKYKNGGYGFSRVIRAIWTDGEKFYALAYRACQTVTFGNAEYMEVEKIGGQWFKK